MRVVMDDNKIAIKISNAETKSTSPSANYYVQIYMPVCVCLYMSVCRWTVSSLV